ncbi:MAG: ArnT family glycosyltransferase, partial [Gemmataceae bacterium]
DMTAGAPVTCDACSEGVFVRHRLALCLILAGSFALRLVHLDTPLLDGMAVKQVYVAHKARQIAGPPFDLLNNSFDFLAEDGRPQKLTEEVPLYTGLLATGYRQFGEHEWLGRLFSSFAMLLATAALYDLLRRDFARELALLATMFFAFSPLLLVYGQAVQPDSAMLAGMLLTACCYARHLDTGQWRWWLAAALCGMMAALFKYYGLMVLLALAVMQLRRDGWRTVLSPRLILLGGLMAAPVALWMLLVFRHTPNPARTSPYFLYEMPELLWQEPLYVRFLDRFLAKDCGPAMVASLLAGVGAALLGRLGSRSSRPLWGWTALALGFYFLLGPLLRCHDYYEMMMMPAAAGWAALGWDALYRGAANWWPWLARRRVPALAAWAVLLAVVHSPWVTRGKFEWDPGFAVAARRLEEICPPGARVVVVTRDNGVAVIHYAHRPGWFFHDLADFRGRLQRCRDRGAEYALVYFNHDTSAADTAAFAELLPTLPVVDHEAGNWAGRETPGEYFIIRLSDLPDSAALAGR